MKVEQGKVKRIPFGGFRLKTKLSDADTKKFEKRGMVPHWFNDQDGRIERAMSAGYKFVDPKHALSLGQFAVCEWNQDVGAKVSKVVSKGTDVITAYLMEIQVEFYNEDQAAKESVNATVDEALALGGKGDADVEQAYRP